MTFIFTIRHTGCTFIKKLDKETKISASLLLLFTVFLTVGSFSMGNEHIDCPLFSLLLFRLFMEYL